MKKLITLVLAAGLFFSAVQGFAVPKDATTLASESVMSSSINRSADSSPMGMISIWATADPIPDGWLECNGQIVNADKYPDYVAKFGATTPDYRGFFLRGLGGKSGALGVAQDYSVQTRNTNNINVKGFGIGDLQYLSDISYTPPTITKNPVKSFFEWAGGGKPVSNKYKSKREAKEFCNNFFYPICGFVISKYTTDSRFGDMVVNVCEYDENFMWGCWNMIFWERSIKKCPSGENKTLYDINYPMRYNAVQNYLDNGILGSLNMCGRLENLCRLMWDDNAAMRGSFYIPASSQCAPQVEETFMLNDICVKQLDLCVQPTLSTTMLIPQYAPSNMSYYDLQKARHMGYIYLSDDLINGYKTYLTSFGFTLLDYNNYVKNILSLSYKKDVNDSGMVSYTLSSPGSSIKGAEDVTIDGVDNVEFTALNNWLMGYARKTTVDLNSPRTCFMQRASAGDITCYLNSNSATLKVDPVLVDTCKTQFGDSFEVGYSNDDIQAKYDTWSATLKNIITNALSKASENDAGSELAFSNVTDMKNSYATYVINYDPSGKSQPMNFDEFIGKFYLGFDSNGKLTTNTGNAPVRMAYNNDLNGGNATVNVGTVTDRVQLQLPTYAGLAQTHLYNDPEGLTLSQNAHWLCSEATRPGQNDQYCGCDISWTQTPFTVDLSGKINSKSRYLEKSGKTNRQIVDILVERYNKYLTDMGYIPMKNYTNFDGVASDKMKEYENYIYSFRSSKKPVDEGEYSPGSLEIDKKSVKVLSPKLNNSQALDVIFDSGAVETRPINKSVKYIVKVE